MYKIIDKENEEEFFSEYIISELHRTIAVEIQKEVEEKKSYKPYFLGAFAAQDVPLLNGDKQNVWVEYDATLVMVPGESKAVLAPRITACIVYDEIPDILLDKYNNLIEAAKKLNAEAGSSNKFFNETLD